MSLDLIFRLDLDPLEVTIIFIVEDSSVLAFVSRWNVRGKSIGHVLLVRCIGVCLVGEKIFLILE